MRAVHPDMLCAHCGRRWNEGELPCEHFTLGHGAYRSQFVPGEYVFTPSGQMWAPGYTLLTLVRS